MPSSFSSSSSISSDFSDSENESFYKEKPTKKKGPKQKDKQDEQMVHYHDNEDCISIGYSSHSDDSDVEAPYDESVSLWILIFNIAQLSVYTLDVFSDTGLAISYLVQGKFLYAFLTLAVVYIAAGIDAYFNRYELKREAPSYKYRYYLSLLTNMRGVDIYRNLVRMKYEIYKGINSVKETQEDFFDRNFRVANLKTHEGLFEACPQLLLQLYIMLATVDEGVSITLFLQIISVFISLCSLALTFITGDKARRLYEYECDNFSNWGLALQFFWIFPITATRILSLSCVASVYPIPAVICFTIHGLIYFMYLRIREPYTTFGALVAAIRVFLTPYEPIEQYDEEVPGRLFRSHFVHFMGNFSSVVIWAKFTKLYMNRFGIYVTILVFLTLFFVTGVLSLTILLIYKQDCFIQDHEKETKMDRRMKPYLDFVKKFCPKKCLNIANSDT